MDPNALAQQIAQLDASYNPTEEYNKATTALGIPDARSRVQGLQTQLLNSENAIKAVDPSVTGRTSNSLVTEAQRQRLVNMERQPLTDSYNDQSKQYGVQSGLLKDLLGQADTQTGLAESTYKTKRQNLADQLSFAQQQQEAAAKQASAKSSGSKAASVDPAQEFLDYISNQFKGAGGAGNKNVSRQTQDAWANAFFDQNGVSKANRQGYWDLFNSTYNRSNDPTKDWRYAK